MSENGEKNKEQFFNLEDIGSIISSVIIGGLSGYAIAQNTKPYLKHEIEGEDGLSIIIPTKNEEKHLPILLDSIEIQNFKNYEVIVVDAFSEDKTKEVAESYDITFIQEKGYQAHAQNVGAKNSNRKHLLFLDADVILPNSNFLKNLMEYTHHEGIVHANFHAKIYDEDSFPIIAYDNIINSLGIFPQQINVFFNIIDYAYAIYVDRDVFFLVDGFKDDLVISQGTDFIDRCPIKPEILPHNLAIFTSDRRFKKYGLWKTVQELIKGNLYAKVGVPISTDYWEISVGIGPPLAGTHYRSKKGELHAVVQNDKIFVHKDKINPHKDPFGHLVEDVLK